jgi:hypothetical protein
MDYEDGLDKKVFSGNTVTIVSIVIAPIISSVFGRIVFERMGKRFMGF